VAHLHFGGIGQNGTVPASDYIHCNNAAPGFIYCFTYYYSVN